jgi:hypothetical protein
VIIYPEESLPLPGMRQREALRINIQYQEKS